MRILAACGSHVRIVVAAGVVTTSATSVMLACTHTDVVGSQSNAIHDTPLSTSGAYPSVVTVSTPLHGCSGTLVAPDTILTASHCLDGYGQGCIAGRDFSTQVKVSVSGLSSDDATTTFTADGFQIFPSAYQAVNYANCGPTDEHSCVACNPDSGLDAATCAIGNAYGVSPPNDIALIHIGPIFDGSGPHAPDFTAYPRIKVITDALTGTGGTPYTVHLDVDASAWSSSTELTIVGWGLNDYSASVRLSGDMQTVAPGEWLNFLQNETYTVQNCNQPVALDGGTINGIGGMTITQRLSVDGGSFNGPLPDHGDSGGPLLVHGGNGAGQVPGLSEDIAIMGVLSQTTGPDGTVCSNNGPIEAGDCLARHAPTFTSTIGSWLDERLSDFDGDDVPDYSDNCPTVPNDQTNSNFHAELVLQQQSDAGVDGHTPLPTDSWDYVEWWRLTFKGDACDGRPTSIATAAHTFTDSHEDAGPCDMIYSYQGAGIKIDVDAGGSCPYRETSGLRMQSFVGNQWGDAKSSPADSIPSWCTCSLSTPLLCSQLVTSPCTVADDTTLPYTAYNAFPTASGWSTMSAFQYPSADTVFSGTTNTHQDPSPWLTEAVSLVSADWDFRNDFPSNLSMDGVVWSHVLAGTFTNNDPTFEVTPFADGFNNHYQMTHVERDDGETSVNVPTDIRLFIPVWMKVENNLWDPATFALLGEDDYSSTLHVMLVDSTAATMAPDSKFTSNAQSVLLDVASGDNDLLFGDDIVQGAPALSGARAGVTVAAGTVDVRGAINYDVTQIDGAAATTSGSLGSVPVRAFSSGLDRLFALRPSFIAGIYLEIHDLASSFEPSGYDTVTTYMITGLGVSIQNPLVMTWDAGAGLLYIIDSEYDYGIGDTYYRLISMTQYGEANELWRTGGEGGYIPTTLFLSAGLNAEVVLGVSYNQDAEFTVFDESGNPRGSYSYTNENLYASVVLNGAGANLGLASYTLSMIGAPIIGPFSPVTTARSSWNPSLCGTVWLRNMVDASTVNALSAPLLSCP